MYSKSRFIPITFNLEYYLQTYFLLRFGLLLCINCIYICLLNYIFIYVLSNYYFVLFLIFYFICLSFYLLHDECYYEEFKKNVFYRI